jgi:hypothetical protein
MDKQGWVWASIETGVVYGLVFWLVTGDIWLHLALASALVMALQALQQITRCKQLFDIADAELVRVSALANSLEQKVADLQIALTEHGIRM